MPSYDLAINIGGKSDTRHIQQAGKEVEGFGKRLEGNLSLIKNSAAAALAAGATFQQAFELSKEGAQLTQLTKSFELMNEQVYQTPDLLNQMTEAVNGTIKETDLMKSLLTLTAGASNDAAQSYAAAAPQLLEIAKASNKLNPALGDTAFLFDSLALGIKRGSPLILDNLGITVKVGEANEKYAAQLGKSVEALTAEEKQMALLNATLEAGDQLISQVGGNVDSQADAWARLTVQVQESTDGFKQWLADGLYPVIEAASGGYAQAVDGIVQKNIAAGKSMVDLVAQGQRLTGTIDDVGAAGLKVTGTYDSVQQGLRDTAMAIIENSNGALDARRNLEAAFGPDLFRNVDEMGLSFIDLGLGVSIFVDEIDRGSDQAIRFSENLDELRRLSQDYAVVTGTSAVGAASDFGAELARLSQMGQDAAAAQKILNQEMNAALASGLRELPTAFDDLTEAQQALAAGQEGAQEQIDEANQAIIDSYRELAFEGALALAELSPDPDAIQRTLDYAVAIGQMTQEEADLRLEAVQTRTAIDELNKLVVQGGLDAEIAGRAFDLLTSGQYSTAEAARQAAEKQQTLIDLFAQTPEKVSTAYSLFMGDSISRLQEVKGLLDGLDGRSVSASVNVNTSTAGDLGGSGNDKGKAIGGVTYPGGISRVGEGNRPELYEEGGNLYLIPGDRGRVFSNTQSNGMLGGGANITININGAMLSPNPQAQARQLATAVAEEMGRVK
jgi:hypothetical protein